MTKMDMVWIAVATLIHPQTRADVTVTKAEIDRMVQELFEVNITPVMINRHLVNSVGRQADRDNPQRGGSRNRYLFRDRNGRFRLYKISDQGSDGRDKIGPTHPDANNVDASYVTLVTWYENKYLNS